MEMIILNSEIEKNSFEKYISKSAEKKNINEINQDFLIRMLKCQVLLKE